MEYQSRIVEGGKLHANCYRVWAVKVQVRGELRGKMCFAMLICSQCMAIAVITRTFTHECVLQVRPIIISGPRKYVESVLRAASPYQNELRQRGVSGVSILQ